MQLVDDALWLPLLSEFGVPHGGHAHYRSNFLKELVLLHQNLTGERSAFCALKRRPRFEAESRIKIWPSQLNILLNTNPTFML